MTMLRTIGLSLVAALSLGAGPVSRYRAVPFVGCASDGQQGPQDAPLIPSKPLPVWTPAAANLDYYVGSDLSVLAPSGWHCLELDGSNGSSLIVSPDPHPASFFFTESPLRGPAVQISYSFGGTSGRFEVAEISARLFPVAHDFVKQVDAERIATKRFPTTLYPADKIIERSDTRVRYFTPADANGLGTHSRLAPSKLPIDGVEILNRSNDMDLVSVAVRLSLSDRHLTNTIIRQVDRAYRP